MIKIKLTPEEKRKKREDKKRIKEERQFKVDINTIFTNSSFNQIPTRNVQFKVLGRDCEIDNIFLYENILVIAEDVARPDQRDIKEHLLNKANLFAFIIGHQQDFINAIVDKFPRFKEINNDKYSYDDMKLIFLYCSFYNIDEKYKERNENIIFMERPRIQYFVSLAKIIQKSTKYELLKFLNIELCDIGHAPSGEDNRKYDAILLPEKQSNFPKGNKIVTFLVEPERLLTQSYVLRKDGWRDRDCVYQRMLIDYKINEMRDHLASKGRVFVNNIIVTLPKNSSFYDEKGNQLTSSELMTRKTLKIQIPYEFNTIGIIDGQHRIFAYYEGHEKDTREKKIKVLRDKQHLLVTGLIYQNECTDHEKTIFEARLFLEINDKQSRAKGHLKQAIATIVNPVSAIAISKEIINHLSRSGPLTNFLEEYFYDAGKIKTSSIVSYGLQYIVKFTDEDTFYKYWGSKEKEKLKMLEETPTPLTAQEKELLASYIVFCANHINTFLKAFKDSIPPELWTLDKKTSHVLTTGTINSLIYCMRMLLQNNQLGGFENYKQGFAKLKNNPSLNFNEKLPFRSNQWKPLGETIYNTCFKEI
ncbi:MAG: hypothetical protein V1934_01240 [Methanobacteriota archaeon]